MKKVWNVRFWISELSWFFPFFFSFPFRTSCLLSCVSIWEIWKKFWRRVLGSKQQIEMCRMREWVEENRNVQTTMMVKWMNPFNKTTTKQVYGIFNTRNSSSTNNNIFFYIIVKTWRYYWKNFLNFHSHSTTNSISIPPTHARTGGCTSWSHATASFHVNLRRT